MKSKFSFYYSIVLLLTLLGSVETFAHVSNFNNKNSAVADPYIRIRLSYKIILNASNQPPSNVTAATIQNTVDEMNSYLETYWRGYRMELVEVVNVGGTVSQWYNTNFHTCNCQEAMEIAALSNKTGYKWKDNAINIYINEATPGGSCAFGSEGDHLIVIGSVSASNGRIHLHEIGHYFELCHTHGCYNSCSSTNCNSPGCSSPDWDGVSDTILDSPCWTSVNAVLSNNPAGTTVEQAENVFYNIMSYHHLTLFVYPDRLTEGQLDRWAEAQDFWRPAVRTGKSWFVNPSGGNGNGNPSFPFNNLNTAVTSANVNGGDIIYLRPGTHDTTPGTSSYTINKSVTLRATRAGTVTIK